MRYFYRVEKIIHRPNEEDVIYQLREFKEEDLGLGRVLATKFFLEEKSSLIGKYSPASYSVYNFKKGVGYNYSLLLIDTLEEEVYIVESSMEGVAKAVTEQKKEEREIFKKLEVNFPEEIEGLTREH